MVITLGRVCWIGVGSEALGCDRGNGVEALGSRALVTVWV